MEKIETKSIHRYFSDLQKSLPLFAEVEQGSDNVTTLKRIENLSQRLETCSSVYELGIKTQKIRDKSRKDKLANIRSKTAQLKHEINTKDINCHGATVNLHKIVRSEIKEYVKTSQSIEFRRYIQANEEKFNKILKTVESNVENINKQIQLITPIINESVINDQEMTNLINEIQNNNVTLKQLFYNQISY